MAAQQDRPARRQGPSRRLWVALAAAWVAVAASAGAAGAEQHCSLANAFGLSLALSTNATGHPRVDGRLDQPSDKAAVLHLDVELGTTACSAGKIQRQVLSFSLTGSPLAGGGAPPGYEELLQLGYFRQPARALEWAAARDACAAEAAALPVLTSEREALALIRAFAFNASGATREDLAWLGASDLAHEGHFVTVAGVPLNQMGYTKWTPGQPSGRTTENCLAFWVANALLEDAPCAWKLPYLCKISL